jgi:hypothetical protein
MRSTEVGDGAPTDRSLVRKHRGALHRPGRDVTRAKAVCRDTGTARGGSASTAAARPVVLVAVLATAVRILPSKYGVRVVVGVPRSCVAGTSAPPSFPVDSVNKGG